MIHAEGPCVKSSAAELLVVAKESGTSPLVLAAIAKERRVRHSRARSKNPESR
jgi:hypothetical protein